MSYSDDFNIRTTNVKFNDVADAIDGILTRNFAVSVSGIAGSNTQYIISTNPPWTEYIAGMFLVFVPHVTCGAAPQVKVNDLPFKAIKRAGSPVTAGELVEGIPCIIIYNGEYFESFAVGDSSFAPIYIDRVNQRVGIGTASPLERLSIDPGMIQINQNANTLKNFKITTDNDPAHSTFGELSIESSVAQLLFVRNNGYVNLWGPATNQEKCISLYGGAAHAFAIQFFPQHSSYSNFDSSLIQSVGEQGHDPDTMGLTLKSYNTSGYCLSLRGNGNIGLNTEQPIAPLHLLHSEPQVVLQDSSGSSSVYCNLDARGTNGSLTIEVDPNNAANTSEFAVSVDGGKKYIINGYGCVGMGVLPEESHLTGGKSFWSHAEYTLNGIYLTNSTTGAADRLQGLYMEIQGVEGLVKCASGSLILRGGGAVPEITVGTDYTEITGSVQSGDLTVSSKLTLTNPTMDRHIEIEPKEVVIDGANRKLIEFLTSGGDSNDAVGVRIKTKNDGKVFIPSVYAQFESGDSPNVLVGDNGGLVRCGASSIRYKTDVQNLIPGLAATKRLRPITYRAKNQPPENTTRYVGFLAEEVEAAGISELVIFQDGQPDGLRYDRFCALLVNAIKELSDEVDRLKAALPIG